ncbi:MAG: hypothetical protein EAZ43_16945 [Betaproteobacteria bacterium]|nr:MAG: hypothetical protein EAZ43_16945 [Betaproteobacteria bacterium]
MTYGGTAGGPPCGLRPARVGAVPPRWPRWRGCLDDGWRGCVTFIAVEPLLQWEGADHPRGRSNGRIDDPVLGRFLSADIVVQFPDAITSYNRYAYVMNNPLAFTDPSGYFIAEIVTALIAFAQASPLIFAASVAATAGQIALLTGHQTAARKFFAAAIMFATAGTMYAPIGAMAAGGLQSGSIEGAVLAAVLSAGLFSMAGGLADVAMLREATALPDFMGPVQPSTFSVGGMGRAGMHFGAGAVRAMIGGSDPLRGGFSAGFAEIAGPMVSGT